MKSTWTDLKEVFRLAIKDDDRMEQTTLFTIQAKLAQLLCDVSAGKPEKVKELTKEFPLFFES